MTYFIHMRHKENKTVVTDNGDDIWYGLNCTARDIHLIYMAADLANWCMMSRIELCEQLAAIKRNSVCMG